MSSLGFWKSLRMTGRSVILLIVMLLVVSVLGTTIHETGHLLVALVFGQQVASFNPFVELTLANTPPPTVGTILNFSGGLFSALIFAITSVILFRKPRGPSLFWLGVPFLFATVLELINGLMEGFFKPEYVVANILYPKTYGTFLAAWAALVILIFALVGYCILSRTKTQQRWVESISASLATTVNPKSSSKTNL